MDEDEKAPDGEGADAGEEETIETEGGADEWVAADAAADEATAVTVEEPTAVRAAEPEDHRTAVRNRRLRAGAGAVIAAFAVAAGGYAIGQSSSSSDFTFDGSPAAYFPHRGDDGDRSPGGLADDLLRGHWRGDGDCPDRQ